MRKPYPTDLSDAQWSRLRSYLPTPKAQGRPRTHSLRDVLDAIFYVLKSGCHWRLLPHDFPPWSTVYYHFRKLRLSGAWGLIYRALRGAARNTEYAKTPMHRRQLWIPRALRPPRRVPDPTAMTPTRTSKGASATSWWIPRAFRSRFTSLRPTYKIG